MSSQVRELLWRRIWRRAWQRQSTNWTEWAFDRLAAFLFLVCGPVVAVLADSLTYRGIAMILMLLYIAALLYGIAHRSLPR